MLKNKKIFISGGAGVIGNELSVKLCNMGAKVLVGDLKNKPKHWSNKINYRQGDLNFITKQELEYFAPDIFIHLAATFERSTETYEFWHENFWHNVRLSHHLMDVMKDLPSLKQVFFASSYLIYEPELYSFNTPQEKPYSLTESDPIYPRNLTGMAKLAHEIELRFLEGFKSDKISFINARIYRGYGKGSRCIISRWIRMLLNNEPIKVFRKEGIFDYIYSEETANGIIKLIENPNISGTINLGTGNARRVSEVIDILKIYFPSMKVFEEDSDIPYEASQANITKLKSLTGWTPKKQLEDTIPEIIEYEKLHLKDFEKENDFNVLVTSISKKIPLLKAVRNACKKTGTSVKLYGADVNPECIGRYFVDEFWEMPNSSIISFEIVADYCLKNKIKAIIPTRDGELQFWAKEKSRFSSVGINVMVSNLETVNYCIDKLEFYKKLDSLRFPAIQTSENSNLNIESFVLKERYGAGSIKIGINISKQEAEKQAKSLLNPIFQPFIDGEELSIDAYIDKIGAVKGIIIRKRDLIINGESQITTTIENAELEKLCKNILEIKGFYGHVVMQVIIDKLGRFNIIEINSRFGGASTLSIACGLDSFYWFILESMENEIKHYPFIKNSKSIKQIRFPEDIII